MGIRMVRVVEDSLLLKRSREVKEINERILSILDDMVETMYENDGVGLAAPQVGILRRLFVADIGDGKVYKAINPEIIYEEGEAIDLEGCLSIPNFRGTIKRAEKVKMKYTDIDGNEQIVEADGLLARCFQHEIDHLNGILINSKYIEEILEEDLEDWIAENR